jgi:hypothetical protein
MGRSFRCAWIQCSAEPQKGVSLTPSRYARLWTGPPWTHRRRTEPKGSTHPHVQPPAFQVHQACLASLVNEPNSIGHFDQTRLSASRCLKRDGEALTREKCAASIPWTTHGFVFVHSLCSTRVRMFPRWRTVARMRTIAREMGRAERGRPASRRRRTRTLGSWQAGRRCCRGARPRAATGPAGT